MMKMHLGSTIVSYFSLIINQSTSASLAASQDNTDNPNKIFWGGTGPGAILVHTTCFFKILFIQHTPFATIPSKPAQKFNQGTSFVTS